MNIYYLKKFRKEAQRAIKARYNPIQLEVRYLYDCVEKGHRLNDSMATDLNMLKRKLLEFRRQYILVLAEEKRYKNLTNNLQNYEQNKKAPIHRSQEGEQVVS